MGALGGALTSPAGKRPGRGWIPTHSRMVSVQFGVFSGGGTAKPWKRGQSHSPGAGGFLPRPPGRPGIPLRVSPPTPPQGLLPLLLHGPSSPPGLDPPRPQHRPCVPSPSTGHPPRPEVPSRGHRPAPLPSAWAAPSLAPVSLPSALGVPDLWERGHTNGSLCLERAKHTAGTWRAVGAQNRC